MTPTERLRALVRDRLTVECSRCGHVKRRTVRDASGESGVPFTVIYRFLTGKPITSDTFDALTKWVEWRPETSDG
jgi:hypothetical protein